MTEDEIKQFFIRAVNLYLEEKDELLANAELMRKTLCSTEKLQQEVDGYQQEMAVLVDMTQNLVSENARVAVDQTEYTEKYNSLVDRYEATKAKYDTAQAAIEAKRSQDELMQAFIKTVRELDGFRENFDEGLWSALVDFVTVYEKKKLVFTFLDGVEITVE